MVPPYLPDVPEVRKDLALYYDEIGRLDHYVGEVLAELDRQGVAGDTLVLFLSDNGRPFPRCKTTLYDSGIRTPLIVRWPGHIEPGSRCGSLVSTIDIAPTVLRLAGHRAGAELPGQGPLAAVPGPDGEGPGLDLRRAELARLRLARPGGPVGAVQVHPERRPRQAPDAPRRRRAEPDLRGDAPAPGRGEADPGAAGLLRAVPGPPRSSTTWTPTRTSWSTWPETRGTPRSWPR